MSGQLLKKPIHKGDQYVAVNDLKLRMTLMGMADSISEKIRDHIYKVYQDDEINSLYRAMRASGIYKHGSKDKTRRKIVDFPTPWVYAFCDTVLSVLYGPNWLDNNKALNHELVKQWWVVDKL